MTVSDNEPVLYEVDDDGVLVLTLNRPERKNLWSLEMETAFYSALDRAAEDQDVRVIVVTGAGSTFCPGLDPGVLDGIKGGSTYATNRLPQTYATTIPKMIIGAINGSCAGIGLAQALCFDYRFAARGAKFTTAFSKRGLPAEDASAWILSRLAGPAHAMDLVVSGRVFLAEEALDLGVVQRLSEPGSVLEDAVEYARSIAASVSPVSMAMMKSQVWHDTESTMEQARVRAQYLLTLAKGRPDFREGVDALVEKRNPQFGPYTPTVF
ncbi:MULTISPECIES: enoyl-CoA hydratase-related protein [Rhodococcus]|uniref:Enoyl-CoA hydratase-related protein n=1 Tax=Rhodococcus oxybenzonivorans TaxID=1990687 RepID=A0AAE4UYU9_9NOCA|nr:MULTISPECIES: enoyl-CoA hydratase-related protein [Rhodococcus]MDV7241865.1 enoyl-CoA hydratase-related protein [Rhodococcus oxybenzonivorans]MDV7265481.1 enoyl-CoA hydratase-related protein [Rhodococcus oxybenzonivorans]MDV7273601.1 enoyl-CoA hydratase-related protein [Rhodococcus oxybenzonivorans]MDV7334147.1 enoyl-CoA hydratase-related protein [Rhodococcus oxybenzonivorans]MDV7343566.1 enoyl-CoA hydratase-related protein [Rhodococcus oxybenzonivorans]